MKRTRYQINSGDGERYERHSTIITSNLDLNEWGDAFPNKLLGSATIDRIRHGAYSLLLDGKSFRAAKPLPKYPKNEVADNAKKAKIKNSPEPQNGHSRVAPLTDHGWLHRGDH